MTQNSPSRSGERGSFVANIDSELRELIPGYLDNRRSDITIMTGAVDKDDFETVRVLGHDMKGSGGGYGFDAITDIGQTLERAAKDQNKTEIQRLAQELADYLERVQIVYE